MKGENKESWLERVRSVQDSKKVIGRQQKPTKIATESSKRDETKKKQAPRKSIPESVADDTVTSNSTPTGQRSLSTSKTSFRAYSRKSLGTETSAHTVTKIPHSSSQIQKQSPIAMKQRANSNEIKHVFKKVEKPCKTSTLPSHPNKNQKQEQSVSQRDEIGPSSISDCIKSPPSNTIEPEPAHVTFGRTHEAVTVTGGIGKSFIPKRVNDQSSTNRPLTAALTSTLKNRVKRCLSVADPAPDTKGQERTEKNASHKASDKKFSPVRKTLQDKDANKKVKVETKMMTAKVQPVLSTRSLESEVNKTSQAEHSPVGVVKSKTASNSRPNSSPKREKKIIEQSVQKSSSKGSSRKSVSTKCSKSSGFLRKPKSESNHSGSMKNERKDKRSESAVSLGSSMESGKGKPYHTTYGTNKQNVSVTRNKLRWQEFLAKAKLEIKRQLADEGRCQGKVDDPVGLNKQGGGVQNEMGKLNTEKNIHTNPLTAVDNESQGMSDTYINNDKSIINESSEASECLMMSHNETESLDHVHSRNLDSDLAKNINTVQDEDTKTYSNTCEQINITVISETNEQKNGYLDGSITKKLEDFGRPIDNTELIPKRKSIYTNVNPTKTEDYQQEEHKQENEITETVSEPQFEFKGRTTELDNLDDYAGKLPPLPNTEYSNKEIRKSIPFSPEKWLKPMSQDQSFLRPPSRYAFNTSFCDISNDRINLEAIDILPESNLTDLLSSRSNSSSKTNDEWADAINSFHEEFVPYSQLSSYRSAVNESNLNTPYITPTNSCSEDESDCGCESMEDSFGDCPSNQVRNINAITVQEAIEKYFERIYDVADGRLRIGNKRAQEKMENLNLLECVSENQVEKRKKLSRPGSSKPSVKPQVDGKCIPFNANTIWTYKYRGGMNNGSKKAVLEDSKKPRPKSSLSEAPSLRAGSDSEQEPKHNVNLQVKKNNARVGRIPFSGVTDLSTELSETSYENEKRSTATDRNRPYHGDKRKNASTNKNDSSLRCPRPRPGSRINPTIPATDIQKRNSKEANNQKKKS